MRKIMRVGALPGHRLGLTFDDGTPGTVDLAGLAKKGVFAFWNDRTAFAQVRIGSSGKLVCGDKVDLRSDALCLKMTGKKPEEVFPALGHEPACA